jgi:AraC-type DNA-binding domain-containing proteins
MSILFSNKLCDFFRDFYRMTDGISISVFEPPVRVSQYDTTLNFHNCIAYPSYHMDDVFCRAIKHSRIIDSKCVDCDACATEKCLQSGEVYIYRCHLGMLEGLIPVPVRGKPKALIFVGQVYDQEKTDDNFNKCYQRLVKDDPAVFTPSARPMYYDYYMNRMRAMSEDKFRSMCSMLKFIADRMYSDNLVIDTMENQTDLIKSFIERNISVRITPEKICESLNISRSNLYRHIKNEYNTGVNEYINKYKIEKAAALINQGKYTVKQISLMVGFEDVNYFSRLFKQKMGYSPTAFKASQKMIND